MPQGKGTYGSQVGRPKKKRTSYVNDNKWYDTVSSASNRYSDLSEGQGGEESDTKRGRVIVESSFTGSEYRKHLDSRKDRGSPSWEKESASLNKSRSIARMINDENKAFAERVKRKEANNAMRIISAPPEQ